MRTFFGMLAGAITGIIGLSGLVTLIHSVTAPGLNRDPMYVIYWVLVTGPLGAILGGVTGAARAYAKSHPRREAGLIAVTGGGIVVFVTGTILLCCMNATRYNTDGWNEFLRVNLPLFGTPFLWGWRLVRKGRRVMAWSEKSTRTESNNSENSDDSLPLS